MHPFISSSEDTAPITYSQAERQANGAWHNLLILLRQNLEHSFETGAGLYVSKTDPKIDEADILVVLKSLQRYIHLGEGSAARYKIDIVNFDWEELIRGTVPQTSRLSDRLNSLVRESFSGISDVLWIYQGFADNVQTYWIFTGEDKYDNNLMDALLSTEIRVLELHPDSAIDFQYVPLAMCDNPLQVVTSNANLIFER